MIKNRLNIALNKFGERFEIIRTAGNVYLGKGKLGKVRRVNIPWLMQYLKESIFGHAVAIQPGDIIHNKTQDTYYFAYILNKNYKGDRLIAYSVILLIAGSSCEIKRLSGTRGAYGGTQQTFTSQETGVRCHLREINADLRMEKPALLEVASFLLYTQDSIDVQTLDRLIIDSVNYQVEHMDKTALVGLFEVQMSLDKR